MWLIALFFRVVGCNSKGWCALTQAFLLQPAAAADTPVIWSAGRLFDPQQGGQGDFGRSPLILLCFMCLYFSFRICCMPFRLSILSCLQEYEREEIHAPE